ADSPDASRKDAPNPARLALAGAVHGGNAPRISIEVGADDKHVTEDAAEVAALLRSKGVEVQHRELTTEQGSFGHDWEFWGDRLGSGSGFHQSAHGAAGAPAQSRAAKDRGQERVDAYWKAQAERWAEKQPLVAAAANDLDRIAKAV